MAEDLADRHPETPDAPLDLQEAGAELLGSLEASGPGRTARNLLPGQGAALSQTLLALRAGATLGDHVTNGPASMQVLRGSVVLTVGGDEVVVGAGQWATVPRDRHGLTAHEDSVVLLTVAPTTS